MNIRKLISSYGNFGIKLWLDNGRLKYSAPAGVMTDERKDDIRRYKGDIIAYLKENQIIGSITHKEGERYANFSLTPIQESYIIGKTGAYEYGGIGCQIYVEADFTDIDMDRLNNSWRKLAARHDMLHAVIMSNGYQRVLKDIKVPVIKKDETLSREEYDAVIQKKRIDMISKVYDVDSWPLFDLNVTEYGNDSKLHFAMDMLAGDSVSVGIIMKELLHYYYENSSLEPLSITYRDYVDYMERISTAPEYIEHYQKDRRYWLEKIPSLPEPPDLSVNTTNEASEDITFVHKQRQLSAIDWNRLKKLSVELNVTPSAFLLSAYSEVIGRWSVNKKYCVSVTSMNRKKVHPEIGRIVGDFTDVFLIACGYERNTTFKERTAAVQANLIEALEHNNFSGVEVIREIRRVRGGNNIYPFVFTSTIGINNLEDDRTNISYRASRTSQVFIDCQVGEKDGGLEVCWDVRKSPFTGSTIDDLFAAFLDVLGKLSALGASAEEHMLAELPEHTKKVRAEVNDTAKDLPGEFLYEGFLKDVSARPEHTALICGKEKYTYRDLYQYTAGAYKELQKAGIKHGSHVVICTEKNVFQIAAVLAAEIAGCVYVPIDPSQPIKRITKIIRNVAAPFGFIDESLKEELFGQLPHLCVAFEKSDIQIEPANIEPSAPAYIIFTSGSTGDPKGVVISHESAVNTIEDINKRFGVRENDAVLGVANPSFDLSVYDVFGIFSAGGKLVLPDTGMLTNAEYLYQTIIGEGITIWNSAPAQMEIVTTIGSDAYGVGNDLHLVLLSGDRISPGLPEKIENIFGDVEIISLGGATEASIWSIYHGITKEDWSKKSIPYGTALANQQMYVLDDLMLPVPDHIVGHIYIAGKGLAAGYYNDPEMTAAKFTENSSIGSRIYSTGDMGKYDEDGVIEFIGRDDTQVKINGHRVELGEIESALTSNEKIEAVAVVLGKNKGGSNIYGFAVPKKCEKYNYSKTAEDFRQYLDPIADDITKNIDSDAFEQYMYYGSDLSLNEIINFLKGKGVFTDTEQTYSSGTITEKIHSRPEYFKLIKRWLNALEENGYIEKTGEETYRLSKEVTEESIAKLRHLIKDLEKEKLKDAMSMEYFENSIKNVGDILDGTTEPQEILFPKASTETAFNVYHDNVFSRCMNSLTVRGLGKAVDMILAENPNHTVRIMEVGAGTGGTTDDVLPYLGGKNVEYHFTDVSEFFINKAKVKYAQYPWIVYHKFDINLDFRKQGVDENYFDIILCANVLHMAHNGDEAFRTLKAISNATGFLIIIDAVKELNSLLTSMGFLYRVDATDEREEKEAVFFELDHWYRNFRNAEAELVYKYPAEDNFLACSYQRVFISRFNKGHEVISDIDLRRCLAERVPDYMMPARIYLREALPLTPNGKINRKNLASEIENSEKNLCAAGTKITDPLEKQIEQIWMRVLNIDSKIGRESNFFEIGGDSLLLAETVGHISDEVKEANGIEWEALMKMMLANNTISLFCAALRNYSGNQQKLMHIFSEGEKGTNDLIVFFSDGTGRMVIYQPLVQHLLDHNCPKKIIGFNMAAYSDFLTDKNEDVIKNLGIRCSQEIEQFAGWNITLLGHCYGTAIAMETANNLLSKGISVKLIFVEDKRYIAPITNDYILERGFAAIVGADSEKASYDVDDAAMRKILQDAIDKGNVTEKSIGMITNQQLRDLVLANVDSTYYRNIGETSQDQRINAIFDAIPTDREKHSAYEYKQFKIIFETFKKSVISMITYTPDQPYEADAVAYSTVGSTIFDLLPVPMECLHNRFIAGSVTEKTIPGTHISCMYDDNAIGILPDLL